MDKKDKFHTHESDALMQIRMANLNSKDNIEQLKEKFAEEVAPTVKPKRGPGRPRMAMKDRKPRQKQCTVYLAENEYNFLRRMATVKRESFSDILVNAALEKYHFGEHKKREEPKEE